MNPWLFVHHMATVLSQIHVFVMKDIMVQCVKYTIASIFHSMTPLYVMDTEIVHNQMYVNVLMVTHLIIVQFQFVIILLLLIQTFAQLMGNVFHQTLANVSVVIHLPIAQFQYVLDFI